MIWYFFFHSSLECLANFKVFYGVCFYKYHIFHDIFLTSKKKHYLFLHNHIMLNNFYENISLIPILET